MPYIFIIQPEEMIIPRLSYGEFKVYFKPNQPEYYFYSDITCQSTIISYNNNNYCCVVNDTKEEFFEELPFML